MLVIRYLAIAVGSIVLAAMAGSQAFETWGGRFVPNTVLKIDPRSPVALVNLTESAWQDKDKSSFKQIAEANSATVLELEPLSYRALRLRGSYYAARGDTVKARELISLSTKLSRRDSLAQLWLADDYGRLGQLDKSLGAFDIVIRTQPDARETAYRMMGAALGDRGFRQLFVKLARRNPPWLPSFLAYNVGEAARPSDLAAVIQALQPLPVAALPRAEVNTLLSRLVASAPIEDARVFYLSLPEARRGTLTSLAFTSTRDAFLYPPFGWDLSDTAGVQAFPANNGKSPSIEAVVMPGYRGTAARKLLFLPAGTYEWSGAADLTKLAPGAAARMVLFCHEKPGQWVRGTEFPLRNGANRLAIQVSGSCPAQLLALELIGADSQTDSSMTIAAMSLAEEGAR